MQTSENILLQKAALKVPGKLSYDKFGKDIYVAHFLRFCKGGTREISKKLPKKKARIELSFNLKYAHRRRFCCKKWLQRCLESRIMTNLARTPKSRIFWDFAKGDREGKFLKNGPKRRSYDPKSDALSIKPCGQSQEGVQTIFCFKFG